MIDLKLTDSNIKEFEKVLSGEMDKAVKHFERELTSIRTGRAHSALVEGIKFTAYGNTAMSIKDAASITIPEARLIVIQPWDQGTLNDIEKALSATDTGLTPVIDGNIIRIRLPEMSTSRRDELVKILGKKTEDSRIAVRNVRKDFQSLIRDSEKSKAISEDHSRRLADTLQKLTDKFIVTIDQMAQKKENEIKIV
jgi:ribosome recycling factor